MSELALKIIRENIAKHERGEDARVLDLGNCGLETLPEEALACVWLEELVLSNSWQEWNGQEWIVRFSGNQGEKNNIKLLPAGLVSFQELRRLRCGGSISHYELSDLSIFDELSQLQQIDVSASKVKDLSPLERLSQLQRLDISGTSVIDLSPLSGLSQLQQLSFSGTQVEDVSPLSGLSQLRQLDLSGTQIIDLSSLSGLTQLQQLYISRTQVNDLLPLRELSQLLQFNFYNTPVSDVSPLNGLDQLQKLNLSGTQVIDLWPLSKMSQLQQLDVSRTQVNDLSALSGLHQLQQLDISRTQVSNLSPLRGLQLQQLFFSGTLVMDLTPLSELSKLQGLNIFDNQVTDLTPLSRLVQLQWLNIVDTQVRDLSPLSGLHKLQELSFSGTQVTDLTPLGRLSQLKQIDTSHTQVTDLSPLLPLIQSGIPVRWSDRSYEGPGIYVRRCPLIHPPLEIVKQGNEAILRYFEEREKGQSVKVREAKLLIVGQGRAGKSSLRTKLLDRDAPLPEPDDTTRGIEISRLDVKMPGMGEDLRINIWDFGGQNIQHYAHQFFLTPNALYALVTNERIQDHSHLSYWLQIVEMLGKKSPVILVQNKDGGHSGPLPREAAIRARFGNVHNRIFQTDLLQAATEPEFDELYKEIIYRAGQLPHIEREYLASFVELRNKLEQLADTERHYLRRDDYFALMPELSEELMIDYANALTFLGICQYFPNDALLREYVFLRPKWIIDALFQLLLHPSLEASQGFFRESDTFAIWTAKEFRGMHALLVRMMEEFELCYPVEGQARAYVLPQRLPANNATYGWSESGDVPVQYKYVFLPKGILTRLICRLHERIERQADGAQQVWSDAVIFGLPDSKGRVFVCEVYEANTIELRAAGAKGSEMLNEVLRKLDDINADAKYDNLQWKKLVPCPCPECLAEPDDRFFHDYDVLRKRLEKSKATNPCGKSGDDIAIADIFGLSGVQRPRLRREQGAFHVMEDYSTTAPLKVFISYSQHDREKFLVPMTRYLYPLMRAGMLETWDDSQILPGEEWDERIKTEIERANVIFLLVSPYSLNTDYTWNTEIKAAMRRHEEGTARVVPILLSQCLWQEKDQQGNFIFPPAKLAALPDKARPVDTWERENEAWGVVAEGVKRVLAELR